MSTIDDVAADSLAKELQAARAQIAELTRSLEAHRQLLENAHDMVWRTDLSGNVLYVNAYAAEFLGGVGAAFVGHTMEAYFTPESVRRVATGVRETLFAKPPQPFFQAEVEYRHGDGHVVPAEVRITAERDATGRVVALNGISRSIAERKQAERSEARFRALFESSPDALMTIAAPSWALTTANRAMYEMFEIASDVSCTLFDPVKLSPEFQPDGRSSAEKAKEMIDKAMRDGEHLFEWTHRRLSGEEFPSTIVLARLELDGQQVLQVIVRDDTEVKRLHASMAQADRLATMGMLAAGVAHEINNPLAYVLANVEALAQALHAPERGTANPELVDMASRALEGTRRIMSITRGLGIFARVERDEPMKVELARVLEGAAAMANNEIKYRATLVWELGEVPAVWASEGKLSQVFLNLLVNAAHATPEGDPASHTITLRTWASGGDVFAEIKDTGVGIAPENLSRIFEPFFTTKKAGQGSGLGLAICKTLLVEEGGELQIESEVGRGTRVVVRLPAARDQALAPAAPVAASARSERPVGRGRVLVVDDEENIRSVLVRLLRQEHDVVTVGSAREAQALLERGVAFDVILCDLMMPDVSGIELHAWLVGHDPRLAARLVFVSGGAYAAGASDYLAGIDNRQLAKPFESKVLRKLVAELVAEARSAE